MIHPILLSFPTTAGWMGIALLFQRRPGHPPAHDIAIQTVLVPTAYYRFILSNFALITIAHVTTEITSLFAAFIHSTLLTFPI